MATKTKTKKTTTKATELKYQIIDDEGRHIGGPGDWEGCRAVVEVFQMADEIEDRRRARLGWPLKPHRRLSVVCVD